MRAAYAANKFSAFGNFFEGFQTFPDGALDLRHIIDTIDIQTEPVGGTRGEKTET